MRRYVKKIWAAILVLALALSMMPAGTAQAATQLSDGSILTFQPANPAPVFEEGMATDKKLLGYIEYKSGGAGVIADGYDLVLYDHPSTLTNAVVSNSGLKIDVDSSNRVYVEPTKDVKKGKYYLAISARVKIGDSYETVETANRQEIVVGENKTTKINAVSISVPTSLTVGDTISNNIVKTTIQANDQYDFSGAIALTPYDLSYNSLAGQTGENVINKSRRYRMEVKLAAKKDCYFPESTNKSALTNLENRYQYGGSLSTSVTCLSSAVIDEGKTLVLVFEYLVDGNGQTIVSQNGNIQTTDGLISVWGNATSNIAIQITGTTATVADIPDTTINTITSGNNQSNVVFDLSSQNSTVNTGVITHNTMTRVVNAVNNTGNSMKALEMRLPKATAVLDAAALNSVASQAVNGGDLSITLNEITTNDLTATQRAGLTGNTILKVIRATMKTGTKDITSFGAGYETISLPYVLTSSQSADKIYVAHIAANGTLTKQATTYANNRVTFTTNHNSDFVIIHEKEDLTANLFPVYRAYNPNNGDHLLTVDLNEYNTVVRAGWTAEKEVFKVSKTQGDSIYRIYNPNTGEHFYTKNVDERNNAVAAGWVNEGSPFKSYGQKPVYRLYNPNQVANNHLFTTSLDERNKLISLGWKEGNIVFYVN